MGLPGGAHVLGITPDIACYAKLLTAGVAPLAVTLTREEVFDAFKGPSKIQALLHGHSYTAYPLGCAAALASLQVLCDPVLNPNVCHPGSDGTCTTKPHCSKPCGRLLPQWDDATAAALSDHALVQKAMVVGSVVAVKVRISSTGDNAVKSYISTSSGDVIAALRRRGVFARPLGPVVYLMVTPTTQRHKCDQLMQHLLDALDECAANQSDNNSPHRDNHYVLP